MDYYSLLGVTKNASDSDIKQAYKKLAMQHHPDRGGDANTFTQINEAYNTLKDPAARQQYDNPQVRMNSQNINDIFGSFFNQGRQRRNRDMRFQVDLTLEEVLTGKNIILDFKQENGVTGTANLHIDAGSTHGEGIRFRGVGDRTNPNIPPGDLLAVVRYARHPFFKVDGKHLTTEIDVDVFDLIKGTDRQIKTLDGSNIKVTIPAGSNPGTVYSVTGHGLVDKRSRARGNLHVKVNAITPKMDANLLTKLEEIKAEILTKQS
jgi:curved DNA-binding protein